MVTTEKYTLNQLRDYSSLFSRSEVEQWATGNFFSINKKINRYDTNWISYKNATYLSYLKHLYKILELHYPNEYIYKNSFLNEWLLQELGKSNSKVFNEFRVGNAIADLVMFNGHSKVFEVKSELDSDNRLELQLENYHQAFNQVFIIVPESKLATYLKYNEKVGIITYNNLRGNKFELVRDAVLDFQINPEVIMNILRTAEYKSLVQSYYGMLPKMTSFSQYDICKKLIKEIPVPKLNDLFIQTMKSRVFKPEVSKKNYKELNQINLSLKLNKKQKERMILNLKSPLNM
ncbi:sce7726 family protein [Aequorivita viscosa]|uniref:Sce7726 family protein n=1 Tax=Aequorivita viscosa TaxID=797419 RepID=A0A1M6M3W0_9FLAO|nr:sce7726 family protein [Aequorivita viscosa]SDX30796.1 hypothetical protein SAMN05216556_12416 [Aequorivita viscosa]SHJ78097.1 hypothetical protein SAMN04487908_12544 [Aequorivita viscosa]